MEGQQTGQLARQSDKRPHLAAPFYDVVFGRKSLGVRMPQGLGRHDGGEARRRQAPGDGPAVISQTRPLY